MTLEEQIQSLQAQMEQLRQKVEELDREVTGEEPREGPPDFVKRVIEKLDKSKEVDAVAIIGSVWGTKHGTNSSLGSATGLESWIKVPDSYVERILRPFTDPRCLAILKTFLDGAEKTREELRGVSGVSEEELDEFLKMLSELRYIEWKQIAKHGHAAPQDVFSLWRHGRDLLLVLLHRAEEQRKYEEESASTSRS